MAHLCVYCGSRANSDEHVVPQWLTAEMPPWYDLNDSQRTILASGKMRWISHPFGTTTVRVCARCNSGWMSDLEGQVKDFLLPMLFGMKESLTRTEQQILATWVWKTLMMFEQATHPAQPVIPAHHYTYLYQHRRPSLRRTMMRLVRVAPPQKERREVSLAFRTTPIATEGAEPAGYIAHLRLFHLGFQIVSLDLPDGHTLAPPDDDESGLVALWPPRDTLTWPPKQAFPTNVWESLYTATGPFEISSGPIDSDELGQNVP
ncbi:hypothetical protein [Streptomyces sp. NBC_01563]|uniref:hypothetical protein n=1 Tax=Streptomyces sp. NBC_01563 TaxID=2975880 RepID=UPI00386B3B5B